MAAASQLGRRITCSLVTRLRDLLRRRRRLLAMASQDNVVLVRYITADARCVGDGDDDDGASDSVAVAGDDDVASDSVAANADGASDSIVAVDAYGDDDDDDDGGDTKLVPVFILVLLRPLRQQWNCFR